jgi:hypothetical protein
LELCLNGEEEKQVGKKCIAPLEPPRDANGCADKNGHFRVRETMKMDARGQFKRSKYVAPYIELARLVSLKRGDRMGSAALWHVRAGSN